MNIKTALMRGAALLLAPLSLLCSCQDEVSDIGGSLASGEVTIVVDSITAKIPARSVYSSSFDARSLSRMLGRLNVPVYGSLDCSFVTQLMSATKLAIPDSIGEEKLDSMRLVLSVPRGQLTGDSLAPQQIRVYKLTKQLPQNISSDFNPEGYYSQASLLGSRSYTISTLSHPDTVYSSDSYVKIPVKMPASMTRDTFQAYMTTPGVFKWPSTFQQYFPGVYVKQNFGNGCVANVTKVEMYLYWNYTDLVYEKTGTDENDEPVYDYVPHVKRDSVCVYSSQPEVISSNIMKYDVAKSLTDRVEAGDVLLTTPGGYYAEMDFPVLEMIREFDANNQKGMSVVSALSLQIPATTVKNDYGITVAPYLLMVRASEREDFFRENKVPDGINSFYATYDSSNGCYRFSAMRDYFLKVLEDYRKGETIDAEDFRFAIVPVYVTLETVSNYNSTTSYVTRCAPYLVRPTLTQLHTDRSVITFTFSSQTID